MEIQRSFDLLVYVLVSLGLPGLLLSALRNIDTGLLPGTVLQWLFTAVILALFLVKRRVMFVMRAFLQLMAMLAYGLAGLYTWGLPGQGLLFVIVCLLLSVTVLPPRYCLIAAVTSLLGIVLIAAGYVSGVIAPVYDAAVYTRSGPAWITAIISIVILGGAAMVCYGMMRRSWVAGFNALRDSEVRYRTLHDNMPVGIFRTTMDGTFISANSALARILGFDTIEALMAYKPADFYLDRQDHKALMDELLASGRCSVSEVPLRRRDGNVIYTNINATLVRSDDTKPQYIDGILEDVTTSTRAQLACRDSEQLLKGVLASSAVGVAHARGHVIMWANSAMERICGFSRPEEYLGKDTRLLYADEAEYQRVGKTLYNQLAEAETVAMEARLMRHSTGRTFTGLMTVTLLDAAEPDKGVILNVIDISDRKRNEERLRRSERRLSQIINFIPDPTFVIDTSGRVIAWNRAIEALSGVPAREMIGKGDHAYAVPFYGERIPMLIDLLSQWDDEAPKRYEYVASEGDILVSESAGLPRMPDGSRFWNAATRLYDDHGEVVGAIECIRDITKIRRTENELKQLNADLENRVRERTVELETANRFKSEFLANMSHEIRTPMNGIIGSCELALDITGEPVTREYLEMIRSSADTLMAMVNDILDFSKIEAGKLSLDVHRFSLRATVETITDVFHDRVQEKDVEFVVDIPHEVPDSLIGDPLRLKQILINLIGNAFKFTETGEIVLRVRLQAQSENNALVLFSIEDTGIGIEAHAIGSLFDAFVQADESITRPHGGSGLGLAISKNLVEMMGGQIWVRSRPGAGSNFSFTARFDVVMDAAVGSRTVPAKSALAGRKALVVDDHPEAREVISEFVATFGCRVDQAASAGEALARCAAAHRKGGYDLVLLDMKMADMSGLDLAARISGDYEVPPVMVMLTGYTASINADDARRAGIRQVLSKPVKHMQLFETLSSLFETAPTAAPRLRETPPAGLPDFTAKRVLLVEDNPINRRVAEAVLQSAKLTVTSAGDGAEALEILKTETFDAILMDVQMPNMDGYEATRHIRRQEREAADEDGDTQSPATGIRRVPIIAMTAHAVGGAMEKCLEAGMDDYVSKPIDRRQLFAVLQRLLQAGSKSN